ncbi:MAG: hypothetical protein AB8F26_07440 [Phycisphaerales bacterium]
MRRELRHPLPPGYSGGSDPMPKPKPTPASEPQEDLSLDDTLPIDVSDAPVPVAPGSGEAAAPKIRTFEQRLGAGRHEDKWARTPNVTGSGAIHVKSFHCRLTGDSLEFLDQQINEWLDAHPQYEVKMVTTGIGTWSGKLKEPNMIVNVWV